MIWQNPWAWLGLAAAALPVIIHLFGRGHARVHRFPTLRFIEASRLLPTRRSRINDVLLLAVRVAIVVVAVAALAQPLWVTSRRARAANASLARVVIVAATDSVNRASDLTHDATTSTVISTNDPSAALPGAVAWLETQPMRGEIAIVSRFQVGLLDSVDIASIPNRFGVRLVRVPVSDTGPIEVHTRSGADETIARVTRSADRTDAEWSTSANARPVANQPDLLAGAAERRRADAARAAAASVPVALPLDSTRAIAVVEPGYEGRATLIASSIIPRRDWMMNVVARVAGDSTLVEAARRSTVVAPADTVHALTLARTDSGRPVILAGESTAQGREQLVFYSLADAGSLSSAALLAAIAHATSLARPSGELEPTTVSDAELASWQRAPAAEMQPRSPTAGGSDSEDSDGRWLWIAVLALLGIETWMRRERRLAVQREIVRDRAA